jgi:hypothetical protein
MRGRNILGSESAVQMVMYFKRGRQTKTRYVGIAGWTRWIDHDGDRKDSRLNDDQRVSQRGDPMQVRNKEVKGRFRG